MASSDRMKRVRQRDTAPERALRRLLHAAGLRFRVCPRDLPGRPDVANKSRRWAIFVHGCFWHGHLGCKLATVPKTNSAFWIAKLEGNRLRDARKVEALRKLGYKVATVWQCELRDPRLVPRLLLLTRRRASVTGRFGSQVAMRRSSGAGRGRATKVHLRSR